jgi:hypothetical protein
VHLIIRAAQDRRIGAADQPALLFAFADGLPEQGRLALMIPASPGPRARAAELAVENLNLDLLGQLVRSVPSDVRGVRERFNGLKLRFSGMEARFAAAEGRFSGMEHRLHELENKVDMVIDLLRDLRAGR